VIKDKKLYKCIMCEKNEEELNGLPYVRFFNTGYLICYSCHVELSNDKYFKINTTPIINNSGYKKKKIPHKLRIQVYERDLYTCVYCGSQKNLTLDHVYPESLGGKTELENLVTACRSCNIKKGAKLKDDING
jgi:hypothetical protein